MEVECPKCGEKIMIKRFGRRPLNIAVTKVCDALQLYSSVLLAANELGCSRGYIYKTLKDNGMTPSEVGRLGGKCKVKKRAARND